MPDLGNSGDVAVLDVLVKVGDLVEVEHAAAHARKRQGDDGRAGDGRRQGRRASLVQGRATRCRRARPCHGTRWPARSRREAGGPVPRLRRSDAAPDRALRRRAVPRHRADQAAQAGCRRQRTSPQLRRHGSLRAAPSRRTDQFRFRRRRARCGSRRLHGGVPRGRPRPQGRAGRALADARRRVPERRLHSVQGAAARRPGHRGSAGDGGARRRVRRAEDRCRRSCATGRTRSSARLTDGLDAAWRSSARSRSCAASAAFADAHAVKRRRATTGPAARDFRAVHHRRGLRVDAAAGPAGRSAHHRLDRRARTRPAAAHARHRRRHHRPRDGDRVRRARREGQRRRTHRRPDAGLRPRPRAPLEKRIAAATRRIMLRHEGHRQSRRCREGLARHVRGRQAPAPQLYDKVLVAVGRTPNGKRLRCEAAGVAVNERGFIPVDRQMRTNVPHIFAIGDVVGQPMLAHKATHEGKVAAEVAAGHKSFFDARVDSVGRLHRSRDRLGRAHRDRGEGAGHRLREGGVPLGGERPLARRSAATKASPSCCSIRRRTASSAAASSARTPAT